MCSARNEAIIAASNAINALTVAISNLKNISAIQKHNLERYLNKIVVVKAILSDESVADEQLDDHTAVYKNSICKGADYVLFDNLTEEDFKAVDLELEEMVGKINTIILRHRQPMVE